MSDTNVATYAVFGPFARVAERLDRWRTLFPGQPLVLPPAPPKRFSTGRAVRDISNLIGLEIVEADSAALAAWREANADKIRAAFGVARA